MHTITTGGVDRATQQRLEKTLLGAPDFDGTLADNISILAHLCYGIAASRGWWTNSDGTPKNRNFGEMLALVHSEVSEALEGGRKDLPAEHIPGFTAVEEEHTDVLVRVFDLAGAAKLRLGAAFEAKCKYNLTRQDHSPEARALAGGKAF